MRITIICSVRSGTPQEVIDYVAKMEDGGHQVYFPPRDTPQDDPTGLNICLRMTQQIRLADEVHIFYNPQSQGIHFDMGVAFALGKKWKLINNPEDTQLKSYIKVIKELLK
jgi:hypothetical protein